ncbi:preprotein translocase [Streptomyces griseus]|uniref:preprotein translocase n=1 Tax=Streptomyces griseus TaxID=1911 RepID=UPI000A843212|nr:preprotein translocase [Streptomyces griseus]
MPGIIGVPLFGPDKLPEVIQDVTGFLRKVRASSENATREIRSELGPEFEDFAFEDPHPKTFVRKHILDGEGDAFGLTALRDALDPRPGTDADRRRGPRGSRSADRECFTVTPRRPDRAHRGRAGRIPLVRP